MSKRSDDFELEISPWSSGGKRRNAGAKPADERNQERDENGRTPYQRYEIHRADKESASAEKELQLARQAKVKADIDEGLVVARQAVIDASAKAFSKCSQALDAIGDVLERDGFDPTVCEKVMELINAAKSALAADLEKTHNTSGVLNGSTPDSNDDFF